MIIAIIPARGGSKRFPRKNIALLDGKPLLHFAITEAEKSGIFDEIIVSSEDREMREIAEKYDVTVLGRSEFLASDEATVPMVVLDVVKQLEKQGKKVDAVGLLLPTSPLRIAKDIVGAWNTFKKSDADYLMSMTGYHYSPFRAMSEENGYLKPFFGDKYLAQDQKNPVVKVHDGSIIFINVKQFKVDRTYYGEKIIGYDIPRERAIDVNEPGDLILAKYYGGLK